VAVGQRRVGQRPQVLSRLQLGRVGRQEEHVEVLRDAELDAAMPAGAVKHQHDLLVWTRSHLLGKGGSFPFEEGDAHRRGQMKDRTAGGGMHEADEIAPREAVLDGRQRPHAVQRPGLTHDGLEADPVLVDCPEFDRRSREGGRDRDRTEQRPQASDELSLRRWVGVDVARPGLQPAGTEPSEGAPAQLPADLASEALAQPGGHGPSAPAVAVGMGSSQGRSQLCSL